jgi:proteasome lid subunit RPN8/RPN11
MFGNKNLRKVQEVFGLLYGSRSGEIISIQQVIPVKHGLDCEKAFTETDLIAFGEIEKNQIKEGLESFGFYISHPKVGFYLSQNEIKNLNYFIQEKKNPYAIALVGDHMELEKVNNLGIQAFHLKNPEKGTNSDFEAMELEIEPPQRMALFKTVRSLIEKSQSKKPFIEEQGTQLAADESIWDFSDSDRPEDKEKAKIQPLLDVLKPDISNIEESFISGAFTAYNQFLNQVAEFIMKTQNDPATDLVDMRIAIEDGMRNLIVWFKKSLIDQGSRIDNEYARTIQMVKESQVNSEKALKTILIALKKALK